MTLIPHRLKRKSRSRKAAVSGVLAAAIALAAPGCAAKRFTPPSDAGTPVERPADAWTASAGPCLGVKTMTAELALSGRAAGTRLRGRVQAGFASGSMRLEGVAPFGQPGFILASTSSKATLLLPRDERVLSVADAAEILDALVGLRMRSDALMAVLAGCVMTGAPTGATMHGAPNRHGGFTRFVFPDGVVFADVRGGRQRVVAAQVGSFLVEYLDGAMVSVWPSRVRITRDLPGGQGVELTIGISQVETNITLPAEAFAVDVPPGTIPISLAELRASGPLGERD